MLYQSLLYLSILVLQLGIQGHVDSEVAVDFLGQLFGLVDIQLVVLVLPQLDPFKDVALLQYVFELLLFLAQVDIGEIHELLGEAPI